MEIGIENTSEPNCRRSKRYNKRFNNLLSILIVALFAICSDCYGQDKITESILPVSLEWSEGSIMLNDGTELKGLLRYNDKNGLLSYESGNDAKSLTARNVAGFEFFDEDIQKQRVFYAFPYEDSQNNIKRPLFFEVIKEFGSFVVLSKVDPIDIEQKSVSTPGAFNPTTNTIARGTNFGTSTEISQTETIYIMDAKSNIQPYIKIVEKEVDGVFYNTSKTKTKMVDDDLLAEHIGSEMRKKLTAYAKENKLSFKRKGDLIKILNYYSELIK
jgi:hypothetical protein